MYQCTVVIHGALLYLGTPDCNGVRARKQIMPTFTLRDGSQRAFDRPVTVHEIAAFIGAGLAKAALAGKVDGRLVDTSYLIEGYASLAIVTERDAEGLDVIRHSCAHLLAQAVKQLIPEAQVTIDQEIANDLNYEFTIKRPFTPEA